MSRRTSREAPPAKVGAPQDSHDDHRRKAKSTPPLGQCRLPALHGRHQTCGSAGIISFNWCGPCRGALTLAVQCGAVAA